MLICTSLRRCGTWSIADYGQDLRSECGLVGVCACGAAIRVRHLPALSIGTTFLHRAGRSVGRDRRIMPEKEGSPWEFSGGWGSH